MIKITRYKILRIIGNSLVAFFSALLGWFFSTPFSQDTIIYFVLIVLGIVVGAILSLVEKSN